MYINIVVSLVYKSENCSIEKKLAAALIMDIKEAFDHISKTRIPKRMIELGVDNDLI